MALLLGALSSAAALEPAGLMRGFDRARVNIAATAGKTIAIRAYVATTQKQRAQGLMNVRAMGPNEGMLFIYSSAAAINMWMKNTYIPLDMLFADTQGRIVHMHAGAVPHDTTIISSVEKAMLVLELNAGSIEAFGIEIGDKIRLLPE